MENNNEDAISLIENVILFIEENKLARNSFDELIKKFTDSPKNNSLIIPFKKNIFNSIKYPKLEIAFSKEDVEKLKGITNISGELNEAVRSSNDIYLKLLYSIAWKQGNLTKLDSIIHGITDNSDKSKTGSTFKAFGKHLRDRSNPIIDQHVMRAYLAIQALKDPKQNLLAIRQLKDNFIDKKHKEIENYKTWLNNLYQSEIHEGNMDFFYYADQILFTLGKTIKLKK